METEWIYLDSRLWTKKINPLTEGNTMQETKRNFTTEDFKTEGGKTLAVFKVNNTSLYEIGFAEGGQVPKSLIGRWTDPVMAQKAIKVHLTDLRTIELAKIEKERLKLEKEAANRAANIPKISKKKAIKKVEKEV